MSKDFWFGCIKKFLKITIPTLITIFTFISFFFKEFEDSLQTLGILGLILVGSFCFSLTLLLELTGIIKIIDDLGQQYIEKNNNVDKSIYSFYKSYKTSLKKNNNSSPFFVLEDYKREVDGYSEEFENFCVGVNHKRKNYKLEISYPDIVIDVIQEISNITISSAFTSLSAIFDAPFNIKQPKSIICKNVVQFKKFLDTQEKMNISISFDGIINGCLLISFDKMAILDAKTMLETNYKKNNINLQSMLISYFKEIGSIVAGTGATSLVNIFPLPQNIRNMNRIYIGRINTDFDLLDLNFNSDESIVSVKNIGIIPKFTKVDMYLVFSICQAKVLADKLLQEHKIKP